MQDNEASPCFKLSQWQAYLSIKVCITFSAHRLQSWERERTREVGVIERAHHCYDSGVYSPFLILTEKFEVSPYLLSVPKSFTFLVSHPPHTGSRVVALFLLPTSSVFMAEISGTSSNSGGLSSSGGAGGVRVPQEPSLKAGVVLSDERVDFLREQAFCVLRVKTDKWNRFIGAEENQKIILDFLDHSWTNRLLLFTGPGGTLHAGDAQVRNARTHKLS